MNGVLRNHERTVDIMSEGCNQQTCSSMGERLDAWVSNEQ